MERQKRWRCGEKGPVAVIPMAAQRRNDREGRWRQGTVADGRPAAWCAHGLRAGLRDRLRRAPAAVGAAGRTVARPTPPWLLGESRPRRTALAGRTRWPPARPAG